MATYMAYPHTTSVPVLVHVASSRILVPVLVHFASSRILARVVVLFRVGLSSVSAADPLAEIRLSSVGPLQFVPYNVFAFLHSRLRYYHYDVTTTNDESTKCTLAFIIFHRSKDTRNTFRYICFPRHLFMILIHDVFP